MVERRTTGPGHGKETHRVSAKASRPGTQASWPSLLPGASGGSHALARGFRFDQLGFDVAPLTDTLTNLLTIIGAGRHPRVGREGTWRDCAELLFSP